MTTRRCHYCAVDLPAHQCRPYGPGGAYVCFPCAMLPAHEERTRKEFEERFDGAASSGAVVLTPDGPQPVGSKFLDSLLRQLLRHHCHARGCAVPVPPERLMCARHWKMVPKALQRAVWAAYRPGQCDDKRPSEAWHAAADAAIAAVAAQERGEGQ